MQISKEEDRVRETLLTQMFPEEVAQTCKRDKEGGEGGAAAAAAGCSGLTIELASVRPVCLTETRYRPPPLLLQCFPFRFSRRSLSSCSPPAFLILKIFLKNLAEDMNRQRPAARNCGTHSSSQPSMPSLLSFSASAAKLTA